MQSITHVFFARFLSNMEQCFLMVVNHPCLSMYLKVYLVDYGLATKYQHDGTHKEFKEEPKKAHDGTIEFTSIDAHKGTCM